jgi:hypothetical protein
MAVPGGAHDAGRSRSNRAGGSWWWAARRTSVAVGLEHGDPGRSIDREACPVGDLDGARDGAVSIEASGAGVPVVAA